MLPDVCRLIITLCARPNLWSSYIHCKQTAVKLITVNTRKHNRMSIANIRTTVINRLKFGFFFNFLTYAVESILQQIHNCTIYIFTYYRYHSNVATISIRSKWIPVVLFQKHDKKA